MNILIVDDSVDFIDLIAETLVQDGHTVEKAYNGQEALSLLTPESQFDLLVLDLIIPDYDGFDVINHVKDKGMKTKVIAMSGGGISLGAKDILSAVEPRVDKVLQKPFDLDALLTVVNDL